MPCMADSNLLAFSPVFSVCSRLTNSVILTIRSACCSVSSSRCSSLLKTCGKKRQLTNPPSSGRRQATGGNEVKTNVSIGHFASCSERPLGELVLNSALVLLAEPLGRLGSLELFCHRKMGRHAAPAAVGLPGSRSRAFRCPTLVAQRHLAICRAGGIDKLVRYVVILIHFEFE